MIAAFLAGIAIGMLLLGAAETYVERWEHGDRRRLRSTEEESDELPQRDPVLDRLTSFADLAIELEAGWRQDFFGPPRWRVSNDIAQLVGLRFGNATLLLGHPVAIDPSLEPGTILIEAEP